MMKKKTKILICVLCAVAIAGIAGGLFAKFHTRRKFARRRPSR